MKHSNVIVHPVIIICLLPKFCLSKIAKNLAKFFGHFNRKKKYLQIDSKWSETRKKHEIGETEFLPVAGAGSRRSTDFPLDNVNTSYHTEFHQILTINVALVPKRHNFHKGKKRVRGKREGKKKSG